ncbi:MAG TPA: GAF domain-containing protein, partial [Candidatus Sumerlaeota bacterium]|nr:GAF domain-containing protein [Candidatus Sumerlaeota bacterium]
MEKVMPDFKNQIERLAEIGIALSAELHLEALLEKIVRYARELSQADAGTLYLLLDGKLHFKILQNDTLQIFQGGAGAQPRTSEPVLLEKNNVSAFAAIEGKTIVIGDVYECAEFDFSGPRRYDAITGYRTRSMLVVPMKNHEGAVIGVLQLINALEPETKNIIPFDADAVRLTEALASQAAIAVSNASLIKETKDLFNGLVKVLAMTIDARSHATRKHIQRVATLNILLARAINEKKDGPFAGVNFSEKEMEAISIAGWLHDVGKITTPNWLVEKKSKLERPFDLIELIRERFAFIREQLSAAGCCKQENPQTNAQTDAAIKNLEDDLQFLCECNKPCE